MFSQESQYLDSWLLISLMESKPEELAARHLLAKCLTTAVIPGAAKCSFSRLFRFWKWAIPLFSCLFICLWLRSFIQLNGTSTIQEFIKLNNLELGPWNYFSQWSPSALFKLVQMENGVRRRWGRFLAWILRRIPTFQVCVWEVQSA